MAVWASVRLGDLGRGLRLDAEYYQPYLLQFERQLQKCALPVKRLGELVRNGYRVVYQNTEIIESGSDSQTGAVRFLQAADLLLSFPGIALDDMGWVSRSDWERYPKGRVTPGELLIEVKGMARKVAIVPDDFPAETLVTGSLFKLQTKSSLLNPYFLLAYLLSRFGLGFRYRCLTNTLIGFVNKEELYDIPVPLPPLRVQDEIGIIMRTAIKEWRAASSHIIEAETRLTDALGLLKVVHSPRKTYERKFHELQTEARFDAEYFSPKYQALITKLRGDGLTLGNVAPLSQRAFDPNKQKESSTFDYIEIGSLVGDGEAEAETLDISEAPSRAKWVVKSGDIITSTVRPIRRLSALIQPSQNGFVCSSGFAVLTPAASPLGIEPEVILTYLRLPIICELLDLNCTSSMYPAISEERLLRMPFLKPDKATRKIVVEKVQDAKAARREAILLLERARDTVEALITSESEQASR